MATSIGTMKQGTYNPSGAASVNITNVIQDSGSDRYLYFIIQRAGIDVPTSVTYNGSAMTLKKTFTGQSVKFDIYELANPSTGSNTLTVNYNPWKEYDTTAYWIISTTGAAGYGNDKTANGLASTPLSCNITSVSSGSAVVLVAVLPNNANYNQTLTVDGSTKDYDPGVSTTPYLQIPTPNAMSGWYKENVSSGNTSMLSDWGYSMAGVAFEIKAGGTPPVTPRRRIIIC